MMAEIFAPKHVAYVRNKCMLEHLLCCIVEVLYLMIVKKCIINSSKMHVEIPKGTF